MSEAGRIKVVYIAGWGRSGSTLLGNMLDQVDGLCFIGELRLRHPARIENRRCGCGAPLSDCEVWGAVWREVGGGGAAAEAMVGRGQALATRHLPLLATTVGRRWLESRTRPEREALPRLYRAIQRVTGSRVIVESSKFPLYAFVLALVPEVDVYVVHLIRDARAVAFSQQREVPRPDTITPTFMPRYGPLKSAALWMTWNLGAELLGRYRPARFLRMRYDDLVARPRECIRRILALTGEPVGRLEFLGAGAVTLRPGHSVAGNPVRLRSGVVPLRADVEWRTRMRARDRWLVTACTWPLLWRYRCR